MRWLIINIWSWELRRRFRGGSLNGFPTQGLTLFGISVRKLGVFEASVRHPRLKQDVRIGCQLLECYTQYRPIRLQKRCLLLPSLLEAASQNTALRKSSAKLEMPGTERNTAKSNSQTEWQHSRISSKQLLGRTQTYKIQFSLMSLMMTDSFLCKLTMSLKNSFRHRVHL